MLEFIRDKARDTVASNLVLAGISSSMIERGSEYEQIKAGEWYHIGTVSLGIINIDSGPIKWINIIRIRRRGKNNPPRYRIILGVYDERPLSNQRPINIKTIRKKALPLFGKVINTMWTGNDYSSGLISLLSNSVTIDKLSAQIGDLRVKSHASSFHGWTIGTEMTKVDSFTPTETDWNNFQVLADYLLSSPRPI